ncbi:hypothetical protein P691DRAFT_717761 [Macrolepiota fuliginosa MF-IS2]|uniref:ZW10 C-terminal helical domain-containing protein n=1 Tax=Macrolepiota fuliginosa MF-IS2 TaxID=1400762 RepID=A0A9P5XRD1_9AGAR|nr:hypothetical protein P691DRAFT_717761 [Macrolepiota fuliginosa MF-IS2]
MAGMAFPIPSHLPRKQDVSSKILNKIDSATYKSLNAALTSTWLNELDETIQATKTRLHERIQSDLPQFQHQLESANTIQTRLQTLANNVDSLNATVTDPQSGLVPVLLQRLSEHSRLVQEAADIQIQYQALSHILRCKTELSNLDSLVQLGKLPEAVVALEALHTLLELSPYPLTQSKIFLDFRRKHQSTEALVQEQLSDAYTRCIIVSPSRLIIRSSIQVRASDNILPLASLLTTLIPASLDQHLTTLRRDIITHFIECVLKQPSSVSTGSADGIEHSISLVPAPPNNGAKSSNINNLTQVLTFLSSHLFPVLPSSVSSSFPQSLFKPTATGLLNILLIPSLPSSFGLLAPFLDLVKRAVTFESKAVTQLEGTSAAELPIRTWVDGLASHYEKQRRLELLGNCRMVILSPETSGDRFRFELEVPSESAQATVVPVQEEEGNNMDGSDDAWGLEEEVDELAEVESMPMGVEENDFKGDAWGFNHEDSMEEKKPSAEPPKTAAAALADDISSEDVDNGWGFDGDEEMPLDESEPIVEPTPASPPSRTKPERDEEPDPGDAWGWNDDENAGGTAENSAWDDDPWADPPVVDLSPIETEKPVISANVVSPKAATRLEKVANKGKKPANGHSATSAPAPTTTSHALPPPHPRVDRPADQLKEQMTVPTKRPPKLKTNVVIKESFAVPDKAKHIIKAVGNIIDECKQFQASSLFPLYPPTLTSLPSSQPGNILAETPASLIDLYIALYPVKFNDELSASVQKGMLFSNSCLYLAHELEDIEKTLSKSGGFEGLKERLGVCVKNLHVLGESSYEQVVQKQCEKVDNILVDGAKGFGYTSDQSRYDECETAINQILQEIKKFAQQLKSILTKDKYYTTVGLITEAALSRILQDILALSDIPEVDSRQLSELCRILNSLEGLFSEDPAQPSFVVAYVPSWLKFNYLSELLEASMADISYLFEEGALVDFEIDELVRLVKALFADTTLRTNTINKLMNGHPIPSS